MPILQVVDSDFNSEVIESSRTVLVDFGAPWCGPCRMIAPVINEIAQEYDNILKVVKINTDANSSIATEYSIRSIPTLMIFKNGIKVDTIVGAVPRSTLLNKLNKHI
uniref:Thioredoxin n=1 Tax=Pleurostichidium falkenbergii TaxID=121064 RepID=A0A4D6UUS7_9FLOR|nr:thioredoxin [Pleurostichidium falkenbergii]QCH39632.1 thioredoxin [Pleurostichidium falkenbergii]